MLDHTNLVIPAKTGIHGLTLPVEQQRVGKRIVPTMDSRLRGNDTCFDCEDG